MNKLDMILFQAGNKVQGVIAKAASKCAKKENGDETLIVKIILMVVAVVLCILFRDQLKTIITNLLSTVSSNISAMFKS